MKQTWDELTITTSCRGYGKYLKEWAESIVNQTVLPGAVCIFTHGTGDNEFCGRATAAILTQAGITTRHSHHVHVVDFGRARNSAIGMSDTAWVMHLDADDMLMPHAIEEYLKFKDHADVISSGYKRIGQVSPGMSGRERLYKDADGLKALDLTALCSGISPFRRSLWEQSPYRLDMLGAWDTALWIGFARLGARFRATSRAVFWYRQHLDSVFNQRRTRLGWARVRTQAQLKALRRNYSGVAIIVPRDKNPSRERERVWEFVQKHFQSTYPDWQLIEGKCPSRTWCKGAAIRDALNRCTADVIVIADADCLVDPTALRASVANVANGKAAWAMPHGTVYRGGDVYTEQVLQTDPAVVPTFPAEDALARERYYGAPGGGIFVVRHVWYDAVGGVPLAFREWGSEDRAFATLANTLLGECERHNADLLHLWHGAQNTGSSIAGANLQLLRKLGYAAQQGKDQLVSIAYTMPVPADNKPIAAWRTHHGTAKPVADIPVETIEKRRANLRRRRP